MGSLHILRDAELADARATLATPPTPAARTVEEVADTVARGFSQKDTSILATVAAACLDSFVEQAGGSFRPATRFLADIQTAFAKGFTAAIQPRPIEFGASPAEPNAMIRGTWTDPGQPTRNVKLMLTRIRDTWYWNGVLYLQR